MSRRPAAPRKSKKVEQGEQTRAQLVTTARRLFSERGFAATSTEDIVNAAGITRGALYHHFANKEQLFEAVFEQLEEELVADVLQAAMHEPTARDRMRVGLATFLDRCLDPAVQTVVLREGVSVLGWDRWHEIDARYALGTIVFGLQELMDGGDIPSQPVEPLAHLVLGAVTHAAMFIAAAADPSAARAEVGEALQRLVDGLRTAPPI